MKYFTDYFRENIHSLCLCTLKAQLGTGETTAKGSWGMGDGGLFPRFFIKAPKLTCIDGESKTV